VAAPPPAAPPTQTPPPVTRQPTASQLDAALFYQVLLGELELVRQDPGAAYSLLLDAAQRTRRNELYRRTVEVALQARAGSAALNAATQWSQANPEAEDAYRYQLQILLALNRGAELGPALQNLVRLAPPDKRTAVIAAIPQTLERASDKAGALQATREALVPAMRQPETASAAWAAVGQMQLMQQATDDAMASAQQALAQRPYALNAAVLALGLMELRHPQAPALVRRYLDSLDQPVLSGDALNVQVAYLRLLLDQRQWAEADTLLTQLLTQQPKLPEAWLLRGSLKTQQREDAAAQDALLRYLELSAELPAEATRRGQIQAYLNLAELAERRHDLPAANAWLNRIERPEELAAVQLRRAILLARQGQVDAARATLRQPPARNDEELRRQLMTEAQMLRQIGRHDLALQTFTTALERFPDDPELRYEKAMSAGKAGQASVMEQELRQLIERQPNFHHAYNALGYALADRNERLDEAKALIEKALEAAPHDPYILDSLGWVEFRRGQQTEALRILQDAYRRRPDAEIAAHLGEVLWAMGQREQAQAIWQEGLLLNPQNDTLLDTLRRLQGQP